MPRKREAPGAAPYKRPRIDSVGAEHRSSAKPRRKMPAVRATPEQMGARRSVMRQLVTHTVSPEDVRRVMRQVLAEDRNKTGGVLLGGEMSDAAVEKMRVEVERGLVRDVGERIERKKARQEARLIDHIDKARKAGKWGAVASLEHVLAKVSGTLQPVKVNVSVSRRVETSIGAMVEQLGAEAIEAYLESGDERLLIAGGEPIEAVGEAVEEGGEAAE